MAAGAVFGARLMGGTAAGLGPRWTPAKRTVIRPATLAIERRAPIPLRVAPWSTDSSCAAHRVVRREQKPERGTLVFPALMPPLTRARGTRFPRYEACGGDTAGTGRTEHRSRSQP